jgi:hypothetical protein
MKIKDIRRVEWTEGRGWRKVAKWDFQVMYEGSNRWEPMKFKRLRKKPELNEYWDEGND